jgi:hypothetical protein
VEIEVNMFLKKENTIRQTQQGPLSTEDAGAQKTEHVHLEDSEKDVGVVSQTAQNYIPAEDEYNVTFKTWIVVCVRYDGLENGHSKILTCFWAGTLLILWCVHLATSNSEHHPDRHSDSAW